MLELKELIKTIEELRSQINQMIEEKKTLTDPEIVGASKMLDKVLNEYERLIKEKDKA